MPMQQHSWIGNPLLAYLHKIEGTYPFLELSANLTENNLFIFKSEKNNNTKSILKYNTYW